MITDTDPRAAQAQLAALRRLGPEDRCRLAAEMSESARQLSFEAERRRHPMLDAAAARDAVCRRLWGSELARCVPPLR